MEFPTGPEEVSSSWLAAQLGVAVGELSFSRIGEGFGLDATLARFVWPGGSVVVKWANTRNGRTEQAFYEGSGQRLSVPLLRFFGAVHDDDNDRSVLLVEDRCDAEAGDLIEGTSDARARALVVGAAEWHACFWGDEGAAAASWCEGRGAWRERVLPFVPRFLELAMPMSASVRAELEGMSLERLAARFAVLCGGPQTLIHGDLHLDNVLFDGDVPIVLDWPGARRGNAAIDLARMLVECLKGADRRRIQAELLDLWLGEMKRRGVSVERDWLEASLRSATAWLVVATTGWYFLEPEPEHPRVAPLRDAVMTRALDLWDDLL